MRCAVADGSCPGAPLGRPLHSLRWLVLVAWIVVTAFAFWVFELRDPGSSTGRRATLLTSEPDVREAEQWFRTLPAAPLAPVRATVVHLYRPDCECNSDVQPHLDRIATDYRERGVTLLRASHGLPRSIIATPAAMVFDSSGRLIYVGPYNDSAWCGVSSGFIERVLDATLAGRAPEPQRIVTRGCYCT